MAVGFPAKTTYANGDVFSASDINDTNGTLNLVNPATNPAGQSNPVLNSAFQVWQRGTSISVSATTGYTADRWNLAAAAGQTDTVSRQLTADTTNLPFIQYCARVQRNSGQTATGFIAFAQSLETINSIPYVGKTVTLSFYARRGANYSSASNALTVALFSGTGTDQNINTGYTGSSAFINTTRTLTTTWQRFEVTGTMPTTGTELSPYFGYTPVGTAGAADFFEITGVQLEVGSVATPFKTYAGTIQGELAACQRYYQAPSLTPQNLMIYGGTSSGGFSANAYHNYSFPVQMRVSPTVTFYAHDASAGQVTLYVSSSAIKSTSVASISPAPFGWTGNFVSASWGTNADSGMLAFGYKAEAEL